MVRCRAGVVINRPVRAVFTFVARAENGSIWNSAVREVRQTSEGPVGIGAEYWMSRHLPLMRRQRRGRIINVGSVAGLISLPFESLYDAS